MAVKSKSATQIYFNKDHEMVRKAVREFVDKEINPHMDEWEEKGEAPLHDLFKKMGDLGFLGIRYDPQYGGQGLDYWYDTVFLEELGRVQGSGVPMAIAVQSHMATPAIAEFGSEYLKETYLKPAIAGEMVASIAVTEPGAGSDVSALQTTAKKEGQHYVLNGSKTYITNGTQADFLTLLARTSDDPGYHSFSLLVVPTNLPGFQVSRISPSPGWVKTRPSTAPGATKTALGPPSRPMSARDPSGSRHRGSIAPPSMQGE